MERNAEYHDAAEQCFALFRRTRNLEHALRGFDNLRISAWHANNLSEMQSILSELISNNEKIQAQFSTSPDQAAYLQALSWEADGWLSDPPNSEKLIQAVQEFIRINKVTQALDLLASIVAFLDPDQQVEWTKYGLDIAKSLDQASQDAYYLLLIEPLLLYTEGEAKKDLLGEIFNRTQSLGQVSNRSPTGNAAVLHGVDLLHPFRIEPETVSQIRQDNVHEIVRSLANVTHNKLRGILLNLLGSSYYRLAEGEEDPELRRDLYEKAKDHFLQSVTTLDCTPAYGELLHAYTLAGTGFLSIAELEQDFERRNELYRLGEEHLRKSRAIGEKTQLFQLRARAAINLGVALERVTWFDMNPESRKERLLEIYNLQLEGRDLAERTKGLRGAGYATMNASEICGFLSDLETRPDKKHEWAANQRELSQRGLELLKQTQDIRGQIVAYGYAAFACSKLANLSLNINEKIDLYDEMLQYGESATQLIDQVPDPLATAYAYQRAGEAALHLGILKGEIDLLNKAASFYEKASEDWAKTGERHKRAQAITEHADSLLFQSSLDFTPDEMKRTELLGKSEKLHQEAANIFSKLFFFHDKGENYWRIGQIHLLRQDYNGAQEYFDKVQKAFDQAATLIPALAEVYSVFSTFGVTLVGLVDGLNIINRGDHAHAALLFDDLAKGLEQETDRSLRQLRQLLNALNTVCQFAATQEKNYQEKAKAELQKLLGQLSPDAYEQQLPYSLHKTIHRLQVFLITPKLFFPPLLLNLPLQEKMLAMAQTRHIVSTALSMYESTASHRDTPADEPTEDIIRNYVSRMSTILANR